LRRNKRNRGGRVSRKRWGAKCRSSYCDPTCCDTKMNFSRERSVSIVFSAVSSCVAQGRGFNQGDEGRLSDGQVAGRDCKIRLENKPQLVKPCIVIAAEPGIYNFMLVHQLGRNYPPSFPLSSRPPPCTVANLHVYHGPRTAAPLIDFYLRRRNREAAWPARITNWGWRGA
jgi:hypothetical protein